MRGGLAAWAGFTFEVTGSQAAGCLVAGCLGHVRQIGLQ